MSTDRDTSRIVRSWLREDEDESADRLLDAVLDRLDTTPQHRATWWPVRTVRDMNRAIGFGLAAAAVVIIAILGIRALAAPSANVGGPGPTATPTPTPTVLSGDELEAGTYQLTVLDVVDATITVPSGWANVQGYGVRKNDGDSHTAVVFWPSDTEVGQVYADPCQWDDGYVNPPVGPTVHDLATALANQRLRGDAVPSEASIDGYRGQMIELSVPTDLDFADCDQGQFRSWQGRYHQGPGQIDRIYILDVGGQRLVIDAHFLPGTSEDDRAELEAIVDSIQLDGP